MHINSKTIFSLSFLFVVLSVFFPIQQIHAIDLDLNSIISLYKYIPAVWVYDNIVIPTATTATTLNPYNIGISIVQLGVATFNACAQTLLGLCYTFLQMVTSTDFLGSNITSGNTIVSEGWNIVRNLANIALIFGLIVIAISIILGYQEGKAKKTLVDFIIIAILINFTPVICGLIIDASNSLMYAFLKGATSTSYLLTGGKSVIDNISSLGLDTLTVLAYFIIMGVYYLCSAVLIFFYVILFLTRYVILQILIIASPLAFASRVFESVKIPFIQQIFPSIFFWNEWWKQFMQWVLIGIPAAFFLYLGNMIGSNVPAVTGSLSDLFALLFPFFFLLCGWSICISSGGFVGGLEKIGGGAAIGMALKSIGIEKTTMAEGGLQWTANRVGAGKTSLKEGAIGAPTGAIAGAAAGYKGGEGTLGKLLGTTKGLVTGAVTAEGRESGRYQFRERVGDIKKEISNRGLANPNYPSVKNSEQKAAEEMAKNIDFDRYKDLMKRRKAGININDAQRTAIESKLLKEDMSKFLDLSKIDDKNYDMKEFERLMNSVSKNGDEKSQFEAYLSASGNKDYSANKLSDFANSNKIDIVGKVQKMNAKDTREKISAGAIENNPLIVQNMGPKQAISILQQGSEKQRNALIDATITPGKNAAFTAYTRQQLDTSDNGYNDLVVLNHLPTKNAETMERFKIAEEFRNNKDKGPENIKNALPNYKRAMNLSNEILKEEGKPKDTNNN